MSVGEFPGLGINRKPRAIRAPANPLDKSTIVSIFPREIIETKHTIQPGRFVISAGSYDKPSVLIVGTSSWWKEVDESQPYLEIPVSSIQVANSVVKDHCNGLLACNMSDAMPGLFYVPGEFTLLSIKKEYKHLLDKAQANQRRWFEILVKIGDVLWARSNGNPLVVSDDMKLAAHDLGLKDKSWLKDSITVAEMAPCPACGLLRNVNFPVCVNCKSIIDRKRYNELGLQLTQ